MPDRGSDARRWSRGQPRCGSDCNARVHFGRPKYTLGAVRRGPVPGGTPHRSDEELAARRIRHRTDGRRHEGGVPGGLPEEAREDVGRVLGRDDPRDLDDRGQAQVTAPERALDLRVLADELGRRLPVLGRACGEAKLPREEREQGRVPQLHPPALGVKGREGDEELGERVLLAAEQVSEAGRLFAGGRHERSIARDPEVSWNARIRAQARLPGTTSRTPRASLERAQDARGRLQTTR
jgi:hypothetical protein